jgi:hypothetical protein
VNDHPSWLALDRHALGIAQPDVAAHLASCETCRARLPAPASTSAAPGWARQLPPRPRAWLAWAVGTRPRALGLAAATFACATLVWFAAGRHNDPHGYLGTKGGPELWLYVKRGEHVALWNGTDPVVPGDLLRLKIQPDRFKHVTVFAASRKPREYSRLYDGAIAPGEPKALPFSLKVDAQPGDESLIVVLGSETVPPDHVDEVLAGDGDKEGRRWSRRLVLAKTIDQRDGSPP